MPSPSQKLPPPFFQILLKFSIVVVHRQPPGASAQFGMQGLGGGKQPQVTWGGTSRPAWRDGAGGIATLASLAGEPGWIGHLVSQGWGEGTSRPARAAYHPLIVVQSLGGSLSLRGSQGGQDG